MPEGITDRLQVDLWIGKNRPQRALSVFMRNLDHVDIVIIVLIEHDIRGLCGIPVCFIDLMVGVDVIKQRVICNNRRDLPGGSART